MEMRSSSPYMPSTNAGLYRRVSDVVRSRIPKATSLYLTQPTRSRSSSGSSASTEELGPLTRSTSPQPEPVATNAERLEVALQAPHAVSRNSSVDLAAAEVGYQICSSAQRHAHSAEPDETLLRHMHVDAIYYLSRALPEDLTSGELEKLSRSMPLAAIERQASRTKKPTFMRRLTAKLTALLISWFWIILPLLFTCLDWILAFERQHQLTERGVSQLRRTYADIARLLSRRSENAGSASTFGALVTMASFWVAGICSEIALGIEEGCDRGIPVADESRAMALKL